LINIWCCRPVASETWSAAFDDIEIAQVRAGFDKIAFPATQNGGCQRRVDAVLAMAAAGRPLWTMSDNLSGDFDDFYFA
jgi:hypothetical protein